MHAHAFMTTYETRQIKGWRTRMEETAAELLQRVWQAPAETVRHEELRAPLGSNLVDHERWFHREFGPERSAACAELKRFKAIQREIRRREWTDEQREAVNAVKRAWYAAQSDAWYAHRLAQNRAWKRRQSPESRAKTNASARAWRARQPGEWRQIQAQQKRARRAANPELYSAIERKHEDRRRDRRNAQRRAAYAQDPEAHRAKVTARRAAKRERAKTAAVATLTPNAAA